MLVLFLEGVCHCWNFVWFCLTASSSPHSRLGILWTLFHLRPPFQPRPEWIVLNFPSSCRISTEKTFEFNKKTPVYKLRRGAIYKPPCMQLIDNPLFRYTSSFCTVISKTGVAMFNKLWIRIKAFQEAAKNPCKNPFVSKMVSEPCPIPSLLTPFAFAPSRAIGEGLFCILAMWNSKRVAIVRHDDDQRQRDDNRNKIFAFWGGGISGQRGKSSKMLFFVGNSTTIKFWNCKFYCREILLSLHRLLDDQQSREPPHKSKMKIPAWVQHNSASSCVFPGLGDFQPYQSRKVQKY